MGGSATLCSPRLLHRLRGGGGGGKGWGGALQGGLSSPLSSLEQSEACRVSTFTKERILAVSHDKDNMLFNRHFLRIVLQMCCTFNSSTNTCKPRVWAHPRFYLYTLVSMRKKQWLIDDIVSARNCRLCKPCLKWEMGCVGSEWKVKHCDMLSLKGSLQIEFLEFFGILSQLRGTGGGLPIQNFYPIFLEQTWLW